MAKGFANPTVMDKENAGHALDVAGRHADPVALQPGNKSTEDTFVGKLIPPVATDEAKRFKEFAFGIGKTRQIDKVVRGEEFLGLGLVIR
jgi:hypothetical protein